MSSNKFEQFKAALIASYLANQWGTESADFSSLVEQAGQECDSAQWLEIIKAIVSLPEPDLPPTWQESLLVQAENITSSNFKVFAPYPA